MSNEETLNPDVELTAEDALSFENGDEVSAEVDLPTIGLVATSTPKATVDAYADVAVIKLEGYAKGTFAVKNSGANAIHYKVLGSVDNGKTYDVDVVAGPVSVAAGTTGTVNWNAAGAAPANGVYTHLKVQCKAAVGGSQGIAAVKGAFTNLS